MSALTPDRPAAAALLAREEVLAILQLIGVAAVLGLGDEPIPDLTPEQRAYGLIVAERALRARGLAKIDDEGRLLVQADVLRLVGTCAFPAQSLVVTRIIAPDGLAEQLIVHQGDGLWVLHRQPEPALHAFQAASGWPEVWATIGAFCQWPDPADGAAGTLSVATDALERVRELASTGRAAEARAALPAPENGLALAEALVAMLAQPHLVVVVQHVKATSGDAVAVRSLTTLHRDGALLVAVETAPADDGAAGTTVVQPVTVGALERLAGALVDEPAPPM